MAAQMGREVLEGLRALPRPAAPIIQENKKKLIISHPVKLSAHQPTLHLKNLANERMNSAVHWHCLKSIYLNILVISLVRVVKRINQQYIN